METKKIKRINLTGHDINIVKGSEKIVIEANQGVRLEVRTNNTVVDEVDGIPIIQNGYTRNQYLVDSIAPVKKGVVYVVSIVVAQAIQRPDFFICGAGIKTKEGKTIGCYGLSPNPFYHVNTSHHE